MSRQKIRVIGRRRSHRQNLTGLRVHRHHSTLTAPQSAIRNILKLRIDRQLHASALRGRTTEQLRHTVIELAIARARKLLIHSSFQTGRAINRGEVTRQSRILERVVIHTLVVVLIIGLHRRSNLRTINHNRTTCRTVIIVESSGIPLIVHQSLRIEELNIAEGAHQQDKHARGRHPHAANSPIHSSHLQNP